MAVAQAESLVRVYLTPEGRRVWEQFLSKEENLPFAPIYRARNEKEDGSLLMTVQFYDEVFASSTETPMFTAAIFC